MFCRKAGKRAQTCCEQNRTDQPVEKYDEQSAVWLRTPTCWLDVWLSWSNTSTQKLHSKVKLGLSCRLAGSGDRRVALLITCSATRRMCEVLYKASGGAARPTSPAALSIGQQQRWDWTPSVSSGCVMRFSRSVTNCCWINWDFHGFDSPLLLGLVTVTAGVVLDFLAWVLMHQFSCKCHYSDSLLKWPCDSGLGSGSSGSYRVKVTLWTVPQWYDLYLKVQHVRILFKIYIFKIRNMNCFLL